MSKSKIMTVEQVDKFLNQHSISDLQNELVKRIEEFKVDLETEEPTIEKLKEKEKDLMGEFDVNDQRIKTQFYPVGDKVEVKGKEFTKKEIVSFIKNFLGSIEVEFRMALGLYETIQYYEEEFDGSQISHVVFDNTIRMLNTIKYKGQEDLCKIIAINNWFLPSHELYSKNNIYTHYLAAKHQELLQLMNPQNQG